jgi:hypothetical protein
MNRLSPITFVFLAIFSFAFSQRGTNNKNVSLLKSTVNTVSSSSVNLNNQKITVSQSIGQTGIIGKVDLKNNVIQQGFLSNTRYFTLDNSLTPNFEEKLTVVISPNPFTDYIKINFSNLPEFPIHIVIYDVSGKAFLQQTFSPNTSITIPMSRYSIGTYLVRILSGNNKFVEKILKVE